MRNLIGMIAVCLLFILGQNAHATGNITTVYTYSLIGQLLTKVQNQNQLYVAPVKESGFHNLEACTSAKEKLNSLTTPHTNLGAIGAVAASASVFTGDCFKVKEFVVAENIL